MSKWLPWLVVALLGGILLWGPDNSTEPEKESIRVADSVYVTTVDTLTRYRTITDSVLRVDTLLHRDTVKVLVERERQACDAVLSACEVRVATRDALIASLKPARLALYGEAGVSVPPSFLGARLDGEAGLALRIKRDTYLQAGATTRGDLRLSVRRQLTLF